MHEFRAFGQPEHHNARDKYGVFAEAARTAHFQRYSLRPEGQKRDAMRSAHIQQRMSQRAEAQPSDESVWQGTKLPCKRPYP